jgi:predicted RNase H-like HicB family nuclease/predicted RNA binding protein YcfA (HicA-like mRNA interferase family)
MSGRTYRYTVIFEREPDGGYIVHCPALPGRRSQGDTLDDAQEHIKEAITVYLESLVDHNEPPFPKKTSSSVPSMSRFDATLRPVKPRQVVEVAEKLGFVFDRHRGSHAVHFRPSDARRGHTDARRRGHSGWATALARA